MAAEQDAQDARDEAARGRLQRLREAAIRLDSHPAVLGAVEKLRRRAPGDAKFGDRLSSEGGRNPAALVARGVSALEPDRPSALHDLGLGALQVWQTLAESAGRGRGDREVTLVFTDLVGFSSWALQAGDEAALDLLRAVGEAVEEPFFAHGGRVVKRLGDGLMAAFDDPRAAVQAALEAQEGVDRVSAEGYRPRLRIGVHAGCPRRLGGDYLGVDVNIAARVAEQAKGGEVLVSQPTLERFDAADLTCGRAKRLRADGAPRELRVCAVSRVAG